MAGRGRGEREGGREGLGNELERGKGKVRQVGIDFASEERERKRTSLRRCPNREGSTCRTTKRGVDHCGRVCMV